MMKKLAFACFLLAMTQLTLLAQQDNSDAVKKILNSFQQSWSAADARALGGNFLPDADLVTPDGTHITKRPQIEAFYSTVFDHGYRGSATTAQAKSIRSLNDDTVLVDGDWSISGARSDQGVSLPREQGLFSAVLVKQKGEWKIFSLREMVPTAH